VHNINSIVLAPGANTLINTESKEERPPEGFIDNTVRVYKMNPDGTKGEHLRDMPAYPDGWDTNVNPSIKRVTPDETEEEDTMPKTEVTNWSEVIKRGLELIDDGKLPFTAAKLLVEEFNLPIKPQSVFPKLKKAMDDRAAGKPADGVKKPSREDLLSIQNLYNGDYKQPAEVLGTTCSVIKKWLQEDGIIDQFGTPMLQTPPETAQAANQEPNQSNTSASNSIPESYDFSERVAFDLAPVKLQLIAATLAEYRVGSCPADIALQVIKKISDMEVSGNG
jgi:hypothetical protein